MIEVEMADDIRKTETKSFGPFTTRQMLCILLSASYSVPIAIHIPGDVTVKVLVGLFLALPVALCGWLRMNNEPFEIVLTRYVCKHFLCPMKRRPKQENPYKQELLDVRKKDEADKIKKMPAKKRKKYLKKIKKGKQVRYSKKKGYRLYR